jgi:hypothetical protein
MGSSTWRSSPGYCRCVCSVKITSHHFVIQPHPHLLSRCVFPPRSSVPRCRLISLRNMLLCGVVRPTTTQRSMDTGVLVEIQLFSCNNTFESFIRPSFPQQLTVVSADIFSYWSPLGLNPQPWSCKHHPLPTEPPCCQCMWWVTACIGFLPVLNYYIYFLNVPLLWPSIVRVWPV